MSEEETVTIQPVGPLRLEAHPVEEYDAATKGYVDTEIEGVQENVDNVHDDDELDDLDIVSVRPGVRSTFFAWESEVSVSGHGYYEAQLSDDSGFANILDEGTTTATWIVLTGLDTDEDYWFRVRAVDATGTFTGWETVSFNTEAIQTVDIEDGAVTEFKIADFAITEDKLADAAIVLRHYAEDTRPVQLVDSLPTLPDDDYPTGALVYLSTDGKLYRNDDGEWTTAVATTDLDGEILTAQIADGAITTTKLVDDVITTAKVEAEAITEALLADAAVTVDKVAAEAIDETKFASGIRPIQSVDTLPTLPDSEYPDASVVFLTTDGKLYRNDAGTWTAAVATSDLSGEITETQIADDSISTPKLQAGSVDTDQLAANAVTAGKILADAIEAGHISTGAVTTSALAADSVVAAKIAAGEIGTDHLAADAVTATKIAAGVIDAGHISVGAIEASHVSAGAIETAALAADAVVADKIAAGEVDTTHLAAEAVTAAKIAAGVIVASHIAADAIESSHIIANAIEAGHIAAGEIEASHLVADDVVITETAQLAEAIIQTAHIQDAAIIDAHIDNLNASKINAGTIDAARISIGGDSTYESGYDPSEKETPDGAQTKAEAEAAEALADANDYTDGAVDGKITTFYDSTEPTADEAGDLWVDTTTDRLYRWDGTDWVEIQDADIAQALADASDAQSTADGKIVSFYVATEPTASAVGDLWFDTDDDNHPYRWDGTDWVDTRDGYIDEAADSAQASAENHADLIEDGIRGDFGHSTDETQIDGGSIFTGTVTAHQIAADTITANEIDVLDLSVSQHIQSASYDGTGVGDGTEGWYLGGDDFLEVDSGVFRGDIEGAEITGSKLSTDDGSGSGYIEIDGTSTHFNTIFFYPPSPISFEQPARIYISTEAGLIMESQELDSHEQQTQIILTPGTLYLQVIDPDTGTFDGEIHMSGNVHIMPTWRDDGTEFGGSLVVQGDLEVDGEVRLDNLDIPDLPSAIVVELVTSQTISDSSVTKVEYDTVAREDDEEGHFSWDGTDHELTVNTAGWYAVSAGTRWPGNSTGQRFLNVQLDGSALFRDRREAVGRAEASCGGLVYLSAGSVLHTNIFQSSGGDLDLAGTSTPSAVFLGVYRVRP